MKMMPGITSPNNEWNCFFAGCRARRINKILSVLVCDSYLTLMVPGGTKVFQHGKLNILFGAKLSFSELFQVFLPSLSCQKSEGYIVVFCMRFK